MAVFPQRKHAISLPPSTFFENPDLCLYVEDERKWPELGAAVNDSNEFYVVNAEARQHQLEISRLIDTNANADGLGIVHLLASRWGKEGARAASIVRGLLQMGADPDLLENCYDHQRTPSYICAALGSSRVAKVLVPCRPNLSTKGYRGRTPVVMAQETAATDDEGDPAYAEVVNLFEQAEQHGFPTVAQLAQEQKWWAVQNLCRRGVIPEEEKEALYNGQDAIGWARHHNEFAIADELDYLLKGVVKPENEGQEEKLAKLKSVEQRSAVEIAESEVTVNSEKFLGQGAFGRVYAGTWKDKTVAVKLMKFLPKSREIEAFEREAALACSLNHPNIVKVFGLMTRSSGELALIMEMADSGPLTRDKMKTMMIPPGAEDRARSFICELISGLAYLHGNYVVHRDLKPDNILCFGDPQEPIPKISDFGLSKVISHSSALMESGIGTLFYMAPEILDSPAAYDKTVDIYSLSVILCEILSGGMHPFPGLSTLGAILDAKRAGTTPDFDLVPNFTPALRSLLGKGFSRNPAERPTLDELKCVLQENKLFS